ncbi:MAG: SAM-dependent methyltransferase [Clostridiales bacterium]|nr:SAM-dependent methyltransferase [Clostridiales bacterium]
MKNIKKRIEEKPSRTAAWTCTCRALSSLESDPRYQSGDTVALKLLPKFLLFAFRAGFCRKLFQALFIPGGMYEYVIARTKYFDSVIESAIAGGFDQILIFGAGYDSRGVRFLSGREAVELYELDAPDTQNAKINQFQIRNVRIPPNVILIPIDFNRESLGDKLAEAGFRKGKRSLYMLEGLIMYLDREAVDLTFQLMDEYSAAGSEIVFDYVCSSVIQKENTLYGEKRIYNTVKGANEEWRFGIERGQAEAFLNPYHFNVLEDLDSGDLEERYFKGAQQKRRGRLNATHCIAHAKK